MINTYDLIVSVSDDQMLIPDRKFRPTLIESRADVASLELQKILSLGNQDFIDISMALGRYEATKQFSYHTGESILSQPTSVFKAWLQAEGGKFSHHFPRGIEIDKDNLFNQCETMNNLCYAVSAWTLLYPRYAELFQEFILPNPPLAYACALQGYAIYVLSLEDGHMVMSSQDSTYPEQLQGVGLATSLLPTIAGFNLFPKIIQAADNSQNPTSPLK